LRGYAVCCTPRSGSSLFCAALISTGKLGRPREYFNVEGVRLEHPDFPDDPDGMLEALVTLSTTPNGVYGLKVHGFYLDGAAPPGWAARLPNLSFVFLRRRDLLRQAISDARAVQTKAYMSYQTEQAPPVYDPQAIAFNIATFARHDARWRIFFARNGIEPLEVAYETFLAAPQAVLDALGKQMGVEGPLTMDPAQIVLRPQRDALTEEWRRRFIEEHRDLTRFDEP